VQGLCQSLLALCELLEVSSKLKSIVRVLLWISYNES
jgi:hypothetical protein